MSLIRIVLIAFGVAADAFAVSVAEGVVVDRAAHRRHALRVALMFGLFQGAMPVLGWLLGIWLHALLEAIDHWVAFGLLVLIGGKMLLDAAIGVETDSRGRESRGARLLLLGLATSIDAFAVGVTLAMLGLQIWTPAIIIGVVTGMLSAIGVHAGEAIGVVLGRKAEMLGGVILIGLGVMILVEHLGQGA